MNICRVDAVRMVSRLMCMEGVEKGQARSSIFASEKVPLQDGYATKNWSVQFLFTCSCLLRAVLAREWVQMNRSRSDWTVAVVADDPEGEEETSVDTTGTSASTNVL